MIGFVGAAVDYSRGNSAKAAMQSAVDSTALMLSKEAQTLTTAQLNTRRPTPSSRRCSTGPTSTNLVVTPTFTESGTGSYKLTLAATGTVPTSFTKLIGQDHINYQRVVRGGLGREAASSLRSRSTSPARWPRTTR